METIVVFAAFSAPAPPVDFSAFSETPAVIVQSAPERIAAPKREHWPGFGWVEWRDGGWWKVEAAPAVEVREPDRPFPSSTATTGGTSAQYVAGPSTRFPAGALEAVITTPARRVIRGGTNCAVG